MTISPATRKRVKPRDIPDIRHKAVGNIVEGLDIDRIVPDSEVTSDMRPLKINSNARVVTKAGTPTLAIITP